MPRFSVVIITFNEERNIERCLRSVQDIADEIVILDSFSTDKTKEICEKYGTAFYESPFNGYVEQKNKAVSYATSDYILSLDADEELSSELKASIIEVKENWQADGYYFNRLTNYCGTWIRHSDWYPDRKLRLWNSRKGRWDGKLVHEKVKMSAGSTVRHLKGDLLHYSYYTQEEFISRTMKYARMSAKSLFLDGKRSSIIKILTAPVWRFIKNYFVGLGILDGYNGLVISWVMAKGVFIKYKELSRIQKQNLK